MLTAMWMSALGLAFALVVSAPASAQRAQGQGQGRGQATLASIPVDVLAEPLKLTDDQKTKIRASQAKIAKATAEARAAHAEITAVLTGEQKSKVEGVVRELGAYRHLGIPLQILPELKLTDDQRSKITPIAEEMQRKQQGLQAAGGQLNGPAMRQVRQDSAAKVAAILTAEQKATIQSWRRANPIQRPGGDPPK